MVFPLTLGLLRASVTGSLFKVVQKELTTEKYEHYLLKVFTKLKLIQKKSDILVSPD